MKIKTKERKVIPDPIDDRKFQEWKEKENSQGDRRRHTVVPGEPVTNQPFFPWEHSF